MYFLNFVPTTEEAPKSSANPNPYFAQTRWENITSWDVGGSLGVTGKSVTLSHGG